MSKTCIGLFGTCGGSRWREQFMDAYREVGIEFFNPQVDDWKPEDAIIEAEHLAEDMIILFPITGETTGLGSLSELGFSILNCLKPDDRRDIVVYISDTLEPSVIDSITPQHKKDSIRARALAKEHLKKLKINNLYIVDSFEEMFEVSVILWNSAMMRVSLQRFNPHRKYPTKG
jgi:hypothetical protein